MKFCLLGESVLSEKERWEGTHRERSGQRERQRFSNFLDFGVQSTAQGHHRTKRNRERESETERERSVNRTGTLRTKRNAERDRERTFYQPHRDTMGRRETQRETDREITFCQPHRDP